MTDESVLLVFDTIFGVMSGLCVVYPSRMASFFIGPGLKKRDIPTDDQQIVGFMRFLGVVGVCVAFAALAVIGRVRMGL